MGAALLLAIATSSQVHASAGCDAINAGAANFSIPTGGGIVDGRGPFALSAGDVIQLNVTRVPDGDGAWARLYDVTDAERSLLSLRGNTAAQTGSYTVARNGEFSIELGEMGAAISVVVTCTAAAPGNLGQSPSQKLRTLQTQGSRIVAQNAGQAISGAIDNAIGDALSGPPGTGGNQGAGNQFSPPAGLGGAAPSLLGGPRRQPGPTQRAPDDGPAGPVAMNWNTRDWHAWANVRLSQSERQPRNGGFEGDQVNATFGIGRRLSRDAIVGVFGGYETFQYDMRSLTGKLEGDGWSAGAYLGWRLLPAVRFDLAGAYSGIDYDARASGAAGAFEGRRWLLSSGLTGQYALHGFSIEPSARVFGVWERQDAYVDSFGVTQADHSLSLGRASVGARVSHPWRVAAATLAPYAGLYGDYHFTNDVVGPAGTEVLAFADGWSARIVAGLAVGLDAGATLSVGGEWGGLGAAHDQRTLTLRGTLPF